PGLRKHLHEYLPAAPEKRSAGPNRLIGNAVRALWRNIGVCGRIFRGCVHGPFHFCVALQCHLPKCLSSNSGQTHLDALLKYANESIRQRREPNLWPASFSYRTAELDRKSTPLNSSHVSS